MNARVTGAGIAIILMGFGCSDDSSRPGDVDVMPWQILGAPVGAIEIDGQIVTMQGMYVLAAQGEPLRVQASLSEPGVTVDRLWFLSGGQLEGDGDPQECFIPDQLCVSHDTQLTYEIGLEFLVALDLRDAGGKLLRVRSELISITNSQP